MIAGESTEHRGSSRGTSPVATVPPLDAGPVVFVDDLGSPELGPDDRHHLERVLRVRRGGSIVCSDGTGYWRRCRLGTHVEPDGDIERIARSLPPIRVGFALVKGEKPELITQKLTEVGVDRIVPFAAERSVVRWDDDRATRHHERLRRVAVAAAAQSRRVWLPEVEAPVSFGSLAQQPGVALADLEGQPPTADLPTVLVGPEGGWSDSERARVERRVSFGTQVMRAETAAIVVGATLSALRAGLVSPAPRA